MAASINTLSFNLKSTCVTFEYAGKNILNDKQTGMNALNNLSFGWKGLWKRGRSTRRMTIKTASWKVASLLAVVQSRNSQHGRNSIRQWMLSEQDLLQLTKGQSFTLPSSHVEMSPWCGRADLFFSNNFTKCHFHCTHPSDSLLPLNIRPVTLWDERTKRSDDFLHCCYVYPSPTSQMDSEPQRTREK